MEKIIESLKIQQGNFRKSFELKIHKPVLIGVIVYFFIKKRSPWFSLCCLLALLISNFTLNAQTTSPATEAKSSKVFLAGAATSNITPKIGTSINGNMKDVLVQDIHDETRARSIVLDDGQTRLAIVVSDLCMVSREVLDEAKRRAHGQTQIPIENMLMSATHTHSAGTACSVFQSDPDKEYLRFLSERIADAVIRANNNLAPARIGWGVGQEPTQVFNRRWKMKPGTPMPNPFGGQDQVAMNPGVGNPNMLEPAGPIDPEVPVIAVQSLDGRPIALLANYSLHYVGGTGPGEVSADYYGMFADRMQQLLGADRQGPPFVAIMSNGTSGDINNVNWGGEKQTASPPYAQMRLVANTVAAEAYKVVQNIQYQDWVSLDAQQKEISLGVRRPGKEEISRAKDIISKAKGPVMNTKEEIYARETVLMNDYPKQVSVILQAFRVGGLAVTAIPCEVFVEIGLELKEKSPFKPTFSISLANGYNGYLPTPAQHQLGGYETWRARSSYLEVGASPKITETMFDLLNKLKASQQSFNQDQPDKTIQLFNGKNLDGWYTFLKERGRDSDPKKVFTVKDGLIRISGEEWGCITTNKEYDNYKLVVEFKWGGQTFDPRLDKARDSGVLLHSKGMDGGYSGTWMHSIECQIIEGGTGDFIVVGDGSEQFALTCPVAPEKQGGAYVFQPGGDPVTIHRGRINWWGRDPNWQDVKGFRGEKDIEKPVGEWNRLECIADGGEIFIYLNGMLVNHAIEVKPTKGRIQIQSEGAEMLVRKVELTPLLQD